MKNDIEKREDIELLVNDFYAKVRNDAILKTIFDEKIKDKWEAHLEKMYCFWETVLLNKHTYFGSPFPPHAQLPVEREHFERWVDLFHATIDSHFQGKKANEAKWRSGKMAEMFHFKIYHLQNQ